VVSPKVSKPLTGAAVRKPRGHSLAPEHLGESGAAAVLVTAIGGIAIFIAAIAMTVSGLTLPGRYAGSTPPPHVGSLGTPQVVGGVGLLVLGILIVGSSLALLGGLARSRPLAIGVSAATALLALAGFALLMAATHRDPFLISALAVTVVAFGGAAVILARLRR
jgi:hypothetical protein